MNRNRIALLLLGAVLAVGMVGCGHAPKDEPYMVVYRGTDNEWNVKDGDSVMLSMPKFMESWRSLSAGFFVFMAPNSDSAIRIASHHFKGYNFRAAYNISELYSDAKKGGIWAASW